MKSSKPKILQVGPDSIHLKKYLNYINTEDHYDLFYLGETLIEDVSVLEQRSISLRIKNLIFLPFKFIQILLWFKKHQFTFIHIHQINRLTLLVSYIAQWMNIPLLTTTWGSDVLLVPKRSQKDFKRVQKVLQQSKYITADAHFMIAEMYAMEANKDKYHYIQYGIEPLNLDIPKENIIYSNRLHKPLYRIKEIIQLFADFHANHSEWKLYIGATGNETTSYQEFAKQLGINDAIVWLGWLDKEANYKAYAKAKIYISIPESDGSSVSLQEALSQECLPIVSDLPANREWIEHGKNGIVWDEVNNPFEEILQIDSEYAKKQNEILVNENCLLSSNKKKFEAIYQLLLA